MTYTVKTPSNSFNGKRAGVYFRNGEATVTNMDLIQVFTDLGYEVIQPEPEAKPQPKPAAKKAPARKKREAE